MYFAAYIIILFAAVSWQIFDDEGFVMGIVGTITVVVSTIGCVAFLFAVIGILIASFEGDREMATQSGMMLLYSGGAVAGSLAFFFAVLMIPMALGDYFDNRRYKAKEKEKKADLQRVEEANSSFKIEDADAARAEAMKKLADEVRSRPATPRPVAPTTTDLHRTKSAIEQKSSSGNAQVSQKYYAETVRSRQEIIENSIRMQKEQAERERLDRERRGLGG